MGRAAAICLMLAGALLAALPGTGTTSFGQSTRSAADDSATSTPTPGPPPVSRKGTPISTPQYGVYEISLTAAGSYGNPYTDMALTATFNGPGLTTTAVRGFWDGGPTFKVRFAPMEKGTWTYSIRSDPPDDGLTQNGSFNVTAPLKDNHGFLRRDADYPGSFVYDDGTRYFMWGQTYYEIIRNAMAGDAWQTAIDNTAAQGMNKVRMLLYPWPASQNEYPDSQPFVSDTDHNDLNLAHWQKLDQIIQYLDSRGMIAEIILFADAERAFGTRAEDERYVRYALARFAGYNNVIWNLANEWNYTGKPPSYWDSLGGIIRNEDPWMNRGKSLRPLTIHQQTGSDFQFFESRWPVNASVQYGVRNRVFTDGDMWGNASIQYNLGQAMPVVNDEYGFIGETLPVVPSQTVHRNAIWGIATAGGYGSAGDARSFDDGIPIFSANWHDSPYYNDVKTMVDFWTARGIEYWKMSSQNHLVTSGYRVYVLGEAGRAYVAYTADGAPFTMDLPDGTYRMEWYNPVTGTAIDVPPAGGGIRRFDPPFGGDAVLHLSVIPAGREEATGPQITRSADGVIASTPAPTPAVSSVAALAIPVTPAESVAAATPADTSSPLPGPIQSAPPAVTSSPTPAPTSPPPPTPAPTPVPVAGPRSSPTRTRTPRPAPTPTAAPPPHATATKPPKPIPGATATSVPSPGTTPVSSAIPAPPAKITRTPAPEPTASPKPDDDDWNEKPPKGK